MKPNKVPAKAKRSLPNKDEIAAEWTIINKEIEEFRNSPTDNSLHIIQESSQEYWHQRLANCMTTFGGKRLRSISGFLPRILYSKWVFLSGTTKKYRRIRNRVSKIPSHIILHHFEQAPSWLTEASNNKELFKPFPDMQQCAIPLFKNDSWMIKEIPSEYAPFSYETKVGTRLDVKFRTLEQLKINNKIRRAESKEARLTMPGPPLKKRRFIPPSTVKLKYNWENQVIELSLDLSKKNHHGTELP